MTSRFLEDLTVGDIVTTRTIEVTERDIVDFASHYDPQFMHTDPAAANEGPFGGLIASGWHTAAIAMRLMVDAHLLGREPLIGLGVDDLRWPRPVRPGDTLTAEIEIAAIHRSHSKPGFGIVKLKLTVRNQNGEIVLTMSPSAWVPSRGAT